MDVFSIFLSSFSSSFSSKDEPRLVGIRPAVDMLGFFGPIILFFTTCVRLIHRPRYLWTYLLVFSTSVGVNHILKDWFREKRPENGLSIVNEEYTGINTYGMPSSHAQSVFTTVAYSYLSLRSVYWLIFDLCIATLTVFQRWSYRRHTPKQLFVGALVGTGIAWIAYGAMQYWVFHDLSWDLNRQYT